MICFWHYPIITLSSFPSLAQNQRVVNYLFKVVRVLECFKGFNVVILRELQL